MIIRRGDRLNERWEIVRIVSGRSISHQVYLVLDRNFQSRRYAVYKMPRLRDLPGPELSSRRVKSIKEESALGSAVQLGYLPEALDSFAFKDYPGIVYQQFGFGHLGGKLLRYELSLNDFNNRRRNLSRVAGILRQCIVAADELWQQSYVHMNFNPDHIFLLPENHIKIIGQSAICPITTEGLVDSRATARWKLSRGYHERETYWRDNTNREINAHHARWNQFATLAIELLFGIDLSVYLADNHLRVIHLGGQLPRNGRTVIDDLNRRYCHLPFREHPELATFLEQLKTWTHVKKDHRGNALDGLTSAKVIQTLKKIENKDIYGRLNENSLDLSMRRYPLKLREQDAFDFVVTDEEDLRQDPHNSQTWYVGHKGVAVDDNYHGPKTVSSVQFWKLGIRHRHSGRITNNPTLLWPGDVVPVTVKDPEKHFVELAGWAKSQMDLVDGCFIPNALSLGFIKRGRMVAYDMPWALIDFNGKICAVPIVNAEKEEFKFIPDAGQLFGGRLRIDDQVGTGIVPSRTFEVSDLKNRKTVVQIREINARGVYYFEVPHEEKRWSVSGAIRHSEIPRDVTINVGDEIPVAVKFPYCTWDWTKEQPRRGEHYEVVVRYRTQDRMHVEFQKDGKVFAGSILVSLLPWGTPEWLWRNGSRLKARIIQSKRGYITLEPLDKPAEGLTAADYFSSNDVCQGTILHTYPPPRDFSWVGLSKPANGITVGAIAKIQGYKLKKNPRYKTAKIGDTLPFVIARVDGDAERIFLDVESA